MRAVIAFSGLGANLYKDAIYAGAFMDSAGKDLNGAHRYVLHFAHGQLPSVDPKAFWSVTLYNRPEENQPERSQRPWHPRRPRPLGM